MKIRTLLAAFIFVFMDIVFAQTQADRNAAKRDVYVVLDVSGSMIGEGKFPNVKEYLEREIFEDLLKTGDTFTLIGFGDSAAERFSRTISSEGDKAALLAELRNLQADNDYTDLGTAMEKLAEVLEKREEAGVRRLILFITDGKNAPPKTSPYWGKNLAVDERFQSIGAKISKGGWFLYVIGIGGEDGTDAPLIAGAVPGSVYQAAGSDLSGLDVDSYVNRVDEEGQARDEAAAAERMRREQAEGARNAGFFGPADRIAASLGIPPAAFIVLGIAALLLLLALAVFLFRAFRSLTVSAADEKGVVDRKLGPFSGFLLNSPSTALPILGREDSGVFRVERGLFGLRLRILNGDVISEKSPYKKPGLYKLGKSIVELSNGKSVRISFK
jgi:Mg-chelatase subunit ChlD